MYFSANILKMSKKIRGQGFKYFKDSSDSSNLFKTFFENSQN